MSQLWPIHRACYSVTVVRGSPNPRHYGLDARLRKARKQAELTRMALGQKAGVSDAIVRYLETDERLPTVETIERLAGALNVSAAWLAFGLGPTGIEGAAVSCAGMGERLLSARQDHGHTRIELARLAELNPGTVAKIEVGGQAGVDTIERLAKALHISVAWLAYGVGPQVLPSRRGTKSAQVPARS